MGAEKHLEINNPTQELVSLIQQLNKPNVGLDNVTKHKSLGLTVVALS